MGREEGGRRGGGRERGRKGGREEGGREEDEKRNIVNTCTYRILGNILTLSA